MKMMLALALAVAAAAALPAPNLPNIVELASSDPDLSTLVTCVKAAGLVDTLESPGPFTVFAPTNQAFAKLPAAVVKSLLDPKNKAALVSVLTYHVVGAAVHSNQLRDREEVRTVEGANVTVYIPLPGNVYVNYARVIKADLDASNGVVHLIDSVILPPSLMRALPVAAAPANLPNIVELALSDPDLSTLVTALKAGDLVATLEGPGPFTVFAPTNEAFAKLPEALLRFLLTPEGKAKLVKVLTYHVVAGAAVRSSQLYNHESIRTVEGKNVTAFIDGADVFINHAQVIKANLDASNGEVHLINRVLVPPDFVF